MVFIVPSWPISHILPVGGNWTRMCVSVLSPVVLSSATITQRYDIPVGMDPVMNPRGHWPPFLTFILFYFIFFCYWSVGQRISSTFPGYVRKGLLFLLERIGLVTQYDCLRESLSLCVSFVRALHPDVCLWLRNKERERRWTLGGDPYNKKKIKKENNWEWKKESDKIKGKIVGGFQVIGSSILSPWLPLPACGTGRSSSSFDRPKSVSMCVSIYHRDASLPHFRPTDRSMRGWGGGANRGRKKMETTTPHI